MAGRAARRPVRQDWGRLVALLLAQFRRLDLAEDALADAVRGGGPAPGLRDGVPEPTRRPGCSPRPGAGPLDRLRAEAVAARKEPLLVVDAEHEAAAARVMADVGDVVEDDLLRLVLLCAHPTLGPESASALSLRLVVGVPTRDVARLFLVPEPTMAARLTRARKRLVGADFGIPSAADLPDRLAVVGQVAYLAFTTGYAPGSGRDLLRAGVGGEAVRLARVVHELLPDQPLPTALLALMLLQHSRRDARVRSGQRLMLPPTRTAGGGGPTRSPRPSGCSRRWSRGGPRGRGAVVPASRPSSPPSTRARQRHPTPGGTGSVTTTRPWSPSTRHRPCGSRRRWHWPSRDGPHAGLAALDDLDGGDAPPPPATRRAGRAARPGREARRGRRVASLRGDRPLRQPGRSATT